MGLKENLTGAAMGVLEDLLERPGSGWGPLRARLAEAIEEPLEPRATVDESLARTERALGDRRLFTTHEVALLLQVHGSAVTKWINAGMLSAFRTPGGHRRVRAQDLKAFCEQHEIPITGELPD